MINDSNSKPRRGVDVVVTEGIVATLCWANPGWRVVQVRNTDTDVVHENPERTFDTLSSAIADLRHTYSV